MVLSQRRTHASDDEVARYGVIGVPQPELDDLALLATQVCHVPAAAINLMASGTQATVAAIGVDVGVCARSDAMCAAVIDEPQPVQVADASLDERWRDNPFVNGERNAFRFYAAHHLTTPRGVTIGTMCIFDHEPRDLAQVPHFQLGQIARRVESFLELRLRTRQLGETVEELARARGDLQRANEVLQLFAAQVAHDLRGPIASIGASRELIRDGITEDDRGGLLVDRAAGSVARMNELIVGMLDFASSRGRPRAGRVDLAAVVEQLKVDLAHELAGAVVEHSGLPVVPGDPTQWRVVLQNLVANAVKFNDADRPVVRIEAYDEGEDWVLEVSDNGPGVPEDDRLGVFGLMTQGDPTRGGIGLGLATCWRIVQAHHGVIVMDAAPDRGAVVRVRVPYVRPAGAFVPDRE